MSDLPSVEQKIQVEATRFRAAVSEFVSQRVGSSINFLIDENTSQDSRISALEAVAPNVVRGSGVSATFSAAGTILSAAITITSGSHVAMWVEPSGNTSLSRWVPNGQVNIRWRRASTDIASFVFESSGTFKAVNSIYFIDTSAVVGPTTYTLRFITGPGSLIVTALRMTLMEIRD